MISYDLIFMQKKKNSNIKSEKENIYISIHLLCWLVLFYLASVFLEFIITRVKSNNLIRVREKYLTYPLFLKKFITISID